MNYESLIIWLLFWIPKSSSRLSSSSHEYDRDDSNKLHVTETGKENTLQTLSNNSRGLQANCLQESSEKLDCMINKISNRLSGDNTEKDETKMTEPNSPANTDTADLTVDEDNSSPSIDTNEFESLKVNKVSGEEEIDSKGRQKMFSSDSNDEGNDRSKKGRIDPSGNLRGNQNLHETPIFINDIDFKDVVVKEDTSESSELVDFSDRDKSSLNPSVTPATSAPTFSSCNFSHSEEKLCHSVLGPNLDDSERILFTGEHLCSPNNEYEFGMDLDGYLSICIENKKIWSVGPFIGFDSYANFQRDGNLVVSSSFNSTHSDFQNLWASHTNGHPMSTLEVLNDGTVQIISSSRSIIWEVDPNVDESLSISNVPIDIPDLSAFDSTEDINTKPFLNITYHPGELVYNKNLDLFLSKGLTGRIVARSGERVIYANGRESSNGFHVEPDAAGCFPTEDGGWYYLSNSESGSGKSQGGGVGRIHFDADGGIKNYKMILEETKENCGGGTTPWGTFITCEERDKGNCWEVHPDEKWKPRPTKMGGKDGGRFESAAFDAQDISNLKGFLTTDSPNGALHRYSPESNLLEKAIREDDFSEVLHKEGVLEFLQLMPATKSFRWTRNKQKGQSNAESYFPNAEGIDVFDGYLYFVSKTNKELFTLNLDTFEYNVSSTVSGPFDGQPDQIVRLLPKNDSGEDSHLYFLEEGGPNPAGIYARDRNTDRYYSVVVGGAESRSETTGLAFCDQGKRMLFAFQEAGIVYEVSREDGQPFHGGTLNIKHHDIRASSAD